MPLKSVSRAPCHPETEGHRETEGRETFNATGRIHPLPLGRPASLVAAPALPTRPSIATSIAPCRKGERAPRGQARPARHDPGRGRARGGDFSRGCQRRATLRSRADHYRQGLAPGGRPHAGRSHPRRVRGLAEPRRQPPPRDAPCARRIPGAPAAVAPSMCCCADAPRPVAHPPAAAPCAPRPSDSRSATRWRRRRDGRE